MQTAKQQIADAMQAFLNAGGKVQEVEPGKRTLDYAIDPRLVTCGCGCKGNYTDHTMRLGESGPYPY